MTALAVRDQTAHPPVPKVLALVTDSATETMSRLAAAELKLGDIAVEGADLAIAAERLRQRASPSVLIVDLDGGRTGNDTDPLAGLNDLAEACDPGVKVVAVGSRNDVGFYRALLSAGVADYLVKPVTSADLVRAIRDGSGLGGKSSVVEFTPRLDPTAPKPRRLVAVIGARGGVGTTTIAANLALVLSETASKAAALIDLDLRFGTSALAFDVDPSSGFKDVLADPTRIDPLLIERAAVKVSDKLVLLAAEEALSAPMPSVAGLVALVESLTRGGDWVVADAPRELLVRDPECLAAAAAIVVVTDLSLGGLREVLRLKEWASSAAPDVKLLIVANNTCAKREGDLPPAEFERSAAVSFAAQVPFDSKSAAASVRQSKPMLISAPRSAVASAIRSLAQTVAGKAEAKRSSGFALKSLFSLGAKPPARGPK